MKNLIATLTVAALIVVAGVSAFAQGGNPDAVKSRMLIAFNRAELSVDQLTTLQTLTQDAIDACAEVQDAQDALQDFLSGYTGSAEDFDAAFEAEQANVQAARDAFSAVLDANTETILDTLTANQFNALESALSGIMSNDAGPDRGPSGPQGQNDNDGPNRGPNNGPDGRGRLGRGGPGGGGNLDILFEVIGEKIAALSGA